MATIDDIRNYFEDILQRSGTEVTDAEINSYVSAVDSGALTLAQARSALINSPEGENVQDVVRLYQTFFGRVPDQAGLNFQVDGLRNGPGTIENIAEGFAASAEFSARFGSNTVSTAFINAVYQQVLGRTPAASEVQFYLDSGFSAGRIALAFSESPEFVSNTETAVENFLDTAGLQTQTYTGSLDSSLNVGSTIVLTTGLDIVDGSTNTTGAQPASVFATAQNDTFVATPGALNQGDQIDGLGGIDTLRVVANGAVATALDSISNVEIVELNSAGAGFGTAELSGVTDLTTVRVNNLTTAATVSGIDSSVSVSANNLSNALTLTYSDAGATGSQTANLSVSNATGSAAIVAAGIETVNLSIAGSSALGVTAAAATALNINAASDVVLGAVDVAATDATITITGAGDVTGSTTDALDAINASASTGDVNFTATTASEFTFTGGSGNDRIALGTSLGANDSIVGGAGTDTLSIANTTIAASPLLTALNTQVTGVEVLELTGGSATITGGTGANAFTNAAVTKILFNTSGLDTINSAGAARTYAFGADNGGDATLNLGTGVSTVNVSLEGSATAAAEVGALTINGNASAPAGQVNTINIASTGAFTNGNTVTSLSAVAGSTFNVTGTQDLTVGGLAFGGTLNASSFTGDLTASGSAGNDAINGGSGADILFGREGIDTISGGDGNDIIQGDGVGIAALTAIAEVQSIDLNTISIADTETLTVTFNGTTFTYTNSTGGSVTGSALAAAVAGVINPSATTDASASGTVVTVSQAAGSESNVATATVAGTGVTGLEAAVVTTTTQGQAAAAATIGNGGDAASADTLSGGAGNDNFRFASGTSIVTAFDTITDLDLGGADATGRVDILTFQNAGATAPTLVTLTDAQQTAVTGAADFAAAVDAVAAIAIADGATAQFTFGSDTYIFHAGNGGSATFQDSVDAVVRVTGLIGTLDVSDIATI